MATGSRPTAAAPRRPLKTRDRAWAKWLARVLTRAGASPNVISIFSVLFAALAGFALLTTAHANGYPRNLLFFMAAACIQLRLLCNMLDGMVAIEGGKRTSYGEIFNDMPDRFADVIILVAAGYAIPQIPWAHEMGWIAGILAVLTAYVRLLGCTLGVPQYFLGPMAKPHRMAVMTGACLLSILETYLPFRGFMLQAALFLIIVGALITFIRRTIHIVGDLQRR